jgi:hypothetical protein
LTVDQVVAGSNPVRHPSRCGRSGGEISFVFIK